MRVRSFLFPSQPSSSLLFLFPTYLFPYLSASLPISFSTYLLPSLPPSPPFPFLHCCPSHFPLLLTSIYPFIFLFPFSPFSFPIIFFFLFLFLPLFLSLPFSFPSPPLGSLISWGNGILYTPDFMVNIYRAGHVLTFSSRSVND